MADDNNIPPTSGSDDNQSSDLNLSTFLEEIDKKIAKVELVVENQLTNYQSVITSKIEALFNSIDAQVAKANADMQTVATDTISNIESKFDEYNVMLLTFSENISSTIDENYKSVLATYDSLLASVNSMIATIKEYVVELKVTASVYLSASKELSETINESSDLINALEKSYSQFASLVETIQEKTDKCNTSVTQLQSAIINILQSIKFNAEALDATKMITSITQGVKNIKDTIIGEPNRRKL